MKRKTQTKNLHPESLPSLPLLLCAACGPFGKSHTRAAGVDCDGVEGIVRDKAFYRVEEPMDLLTLHRFVGESPPLRAAISAVCEKRYRMESARAPYRKKKKDCQENLALLARGALLLGEESRFTELFAERVARRGGGFLWADEGIEPPHYWEIVLGVGLTGSELVPEGPAREEILRLEAEWYAFGARPAGAARGKGACGAPEEEALQVAAALRSADAEALKELAGQESEMAAAASLMLAGSWKEASIAFEKVLGWTRHDTMFLSRIHALPLLVYASLCVLLGKGKVRSLDAWLRTLREESAPMPDIMRLQYRSEMRAFTEHLKLVDSLLHRQSVPVSTILACNSFGCLPLALAYSALPTNVRKRLPVNILARGVDMLAQEGQVLLATYGAAALLGEELSSEWETRMEELVAAAPGVRLPAVLTEAATNELLDSLQEMEQCQQGLLWRILPPERGTLPQVRVCHKAGHLQLRLPRGDYYRGAEYIGILQRYAWNNHVMLNVSAAPRLMDLSVGMMRSVELTGALQPPGCDIVEATPQLVMLMEILNRGQVRACLRLRALPGADPLLVPGWGQDGVLVETEGKRLFVQRDLVQEGKLAKKALHSLGLPEKQVAELAGVGAVVMDELESVMALMRACQDNGMPLCWKGARRLRLYRPLRALNLHLGALGSDWLDLGAELEVDEDKVLELSSLLSAFAHRERGILPLGEDEYVLLSEGLERQLALLELVWQKKGKRHGVHRSALPLLEALTQEDQAQKAPEPAAAVPAGLKAELRPYQKAGFEWLASRSQKGVGAILADDMGLGKTVQMLALLLHEAQKEGAGPSLVVAPVSLLGNWAAEAARFAPSLHVFTLDTKGQEIPDSLPPGALVLVSYGRLAAYPELFSDRTWNIIALDEAQAIKNPESQRAHAVCALKSRMRFCLTGTPIENSLLDLWSEMHFLNPGLFGSREAFSRKFSRVEEKGKKLLRQVLAPLVLRRTKGEVLRQLPALTETQEQVEFSAKERALYESIRRAAVKKLRDEHVTNGGGIGMLAELTRLRRACCHGRLVLDSFAGSSSKLEVMVAKVVELKAAQRRVLIFSQFTDVLDLAEPVLNEAGVSWLRLDGSTPAARRSALVRRFQEGEADVFLISLKAGGVGLNLTAADYVLLLDPWWNPAVEDQAASRAHRMGQQNPVTVCRLVVRDTVEERILQMHRDKKELAESILSSGGKGVSLEVLRSLLTDEKRPARK